MSKGIIDYYKKNLAGLVYGAVWGAIAVAIGSTVNSLIDILNSIGDFLLEIVKWIIIFPAKIGGFFGTGQMLWIVAIVAGALVGPLALYILKLVWKLFKRSPV